MKRFHVHLHVNDLAQNIAFYAALFNQPPTRTESDYAKWMLEDPPVNFAISTRGAGTRGGCGLLRRGTRPGRRVVLRPFGQRRPCGPALLRVTPPRRGERPARVTALSHSTRIIQQKLKY